MIWVPDLSGFQIPTGFASIQSESLNKVLFLFQVEEIPATNGSKNGKESSKEPDSNEEGVEDVDIDDI